MCRRKSIAFLQQFGFQIGFINAQMNILYQIVGPSMGNKSTVRNVSGGQERHRPLQVADPTLRAVRTRIVGVRRRCGVLYVVCMS